MPSQKTSWGHELDGSLVRGNKIVQRLTFELPKIHYRRRVIAIELEENGKAGSNNKCYLQYMI